MTKFSAQDKYPEYDAMRNRQPHVPGQDFHPVLFENVLTDKELKDLQNFYDNFPSENITVQSYSAHGSLGVHLKNEKEIIKRVEKLASDAVGEELVVLDIEGARYSREFGWEAKLGPHYDARPVEMYVLDFHVKSNENWKLIFEGDEFEFYDNQGLLFSGTGTVHWRDPIRIRDDSRIDLLFFWLQHKVPRPISDQHAKSMKERQHFFLTNIDPVSPLTKEEWWKPIKISDVSEKYPHYQKISAEILDPITHNEVYKYTLSENEKDVIYSGCKIKDDMLTAVDLDEKILAKIVEKMLHVYTESSINFIDSHAVRYSSIEDDLGSLFYKKRKDGQECVSIMFPMSKDVNINLNIDGKDFNIKNDMFITFSETNQEIRVINMDEPTDLFFCSFEIKNKDNKYV
jgi:hypothetical protein